jgi:hypothetical protein
MVLTFQEGRHEYFEDEDQAHFEDYASDDAGDALDDVEESVLELEELMSRAVYTPTNSTITRICGRICLGFPSCQCRVPSAHGRLRLWRRIRGVPGPRQDSKTPSRCISARGFKPRINERTRRCFHFWRRSRRRLSSIATRPTILRRCHGSPAPLSGKDYFTRESVLQPRPLIARTDSVIVNSNLLTTRYLSPNNRPFYVT